MPTMAIFNGASKMHRRYISFLSAAGSLRDAPAPRGLRRAKSGRSSSNLKSSRRKSIFVVAPTIEIPNSDICSSSAGPITIDTIEISPVSIPSVTLKDFGGTFTYGSAKAKNVDIEMTINISSTFSGEVITPDWLPNVNVSGGINFDPFVQSNSLGDIDMDGGSFTMKAAP